jgi:hypothetical protein
MKYQIRKRENVTLYLASDIVELDDEAFRKLENNPYTGNSEEKFLKYIASLDTWDGLPEDLDSDQYEELSKIKGDYLNMQEFDNSAQKFEDSWFESGEANDEYRKAGKFKINLSTIED